MGPAHPHMTGRGRPKRTTATAFLTAALFGAVAPACAQVLGVEDINVTEEVGPPCQEDVQCPEVADSPEQCAERACVGGRCVYRTRDQDEDGYRTSAPCSIDLPGVAVVPGDDCDDADPLLHPGKKRSCGSAPGAPSPFPAGHPLGECRNGEQACVDGAVGPCEGVVGPSPETCDGAKDENCDGAIDEGCPCSGAVSRGCGIAIGACAQGTQTCTDEKWSGCVGGTGPKPRDCTSSNDEDCDGEIDSTQCGCEIGAVRSCVVPGQKGACSAGKQTCIASADKTTTTFGPCEQTVRPAPLKCDGGDHDCNGIVDNEQDAPLGKEDAGNVCGHIFFCEAPDRREVCYINGIGYTYYCTGTRRRIGYAKKASSDGSPNPKPPAGYVRLAVNGAGTKMGPYKPVGSSCCGPGGCSKPGDQFDGVFVSTGELDTQLYTRWP